MKQDIFISEKDIESATDSGYYHDGVYGRTTTDFDLRHVNGKVMNLRYCDWRNEEEGVRTTVYDSQGNEILRYDLDFNINDWKDLGAAILKVIPKEEIERRKKKMLENKSAEKLKEKSTPSAFEKLGFRAFSA